MKSILIPNLSNLSNFDNWWIEIHLADSRGRSVIESDRNKFLLSLISTNKLSSRNMTLWLYVGKSATKHKVLCHHTVYTVHINLSYPKNSEEPTFPSVYSDGLKHSIMLWSPALDLELVVVVAVAPGPVAPEYSGRGSDPGRWPGQGCQSSGWPPAAIALQGSSPHHTEHSEGHAEKKKRERTPND